MDTKLTLEQFGLHGRKADVYLAALELGGASVIDISRKANTKRTTVYDILLDLKNDGLISETMKGAKRLFIGEDPEKIKKDLEKKEALFSEILPQLKSIYNVKGMKPKIKFYEGKEGLIEAYDDALKYSGEVLAFGSEDVLNVLGQDWAEQYIKRRVKKNIRIRAILPETKQLTENIVARDQEHLRACKLIKKEKYPFSVEVDIYGHQKVALISCKEQMAVIIESAEINNTMKWIFEMCWDNLPEIKIK
ncbi:MAG: helix-turn-helix domain-containing protein [Parcubacteria group bacterium]|jgi:sugar-specific transcriptional regulator TrmB